MSRPALAGVAFLAAALLGGCAIETAPTTRLPRRAPLIASISSRSMRSRSSIAWAASITASPAAVGRMPWAVRSKSTTPASSSSCLSCKVMAGAVNPNALAALMIFPCAWMARSARSWRRVTCRMPADNIF